MLSLAASITFSSCSKVEISDAKSTLRFDNSALNQVVFEKNSHLQKVMYNSLSASEKLELWSKKFDIILNSRKLSSAQRTFLIEIKGILNTNLFENSNTNKFDDRLIKQKAFELFGVDEAYNILSTLRTETDLGEPQYFQPTTECVCSIESSWCGNILCGQDICREGSGCGTLFLYTCDGKCNRNKPPEY